MIMQNKLYPKEMYIQRLVVACDLPQELIFFLTNRKKIQCKLYEDY